jgi:hypothetical protein
MFVSAVTSFAHEADMNVGTEAVSLFQAQVEVQRRTKTASLEVEDNDEYELSDPLNCARENISPVELIAKPSAVTTREPQQTETDAPGSDVLRMFLQAMTILLVLDGIWKGHLQMQKFEAEDVKSNQAAHEEAAGKVAWTKMVQAAKSGDEVAFMESLALHPVVTQTDAWGFSPLHFAASGGSAVIVSELLKLGAEVDALDAVDETPLHVVARTGSVSICELLIDAGANVDAVNKQGMTPIVVSGHANQEPVCRFLAESGAGFGGLQDEELPPLVVSQAVRKMLIAEPCAFPESECSGMASE